MERYVTYQKEYLQRRDHLHVCSVIYTDGQINLKEIGYEGTEWMELTEGRVQ
jgi:hypothetical protein